VGDVLVLCYHAVSDSWRTPLAVSQAALRAQLAHLVAAGYRGETFAAALTAPRADKVVAVTFDDAYRSVLDLAAPVLAELRLPATVFVPTSFPGGGGLLRWPGIDHWLGTEHEHELAPLSWPQLAALAERGWEIGSHTCTHPQLTRLDDRRLDRELELSRRTCERELGVACGSIAYPYGDVDARVIASARQAGYQAGAGLPEGRARRDVMAWPRIGIYDDDLSRFRRHVSPLFRRARGVSPAGVRLAGTARGRVGSLARRLRAGRAGSDGRPRGRRGASRRRDRTPG
jgi:peptidoglycan/xylan/chitin deacetylase (PgdA/CDA1 family)